MEKACSENFKYFREQLLMQGEIKGASFYSLKNPFVYFLHLLHLLLHT